MIGPLSITLQEQYLIGVAQGKGSPVLQLYFRQKVPERRVAPAADANADANRDDTWRYSVNWPPKYNPRILFICRSFRIQRYYTD